jgi:hypothetical protein
MGPMMMSEQCLIPRAVAGGVGLLQVLKDDIHHLKDATSRAWVSGDLRDRGHAKVHQNHGHVPHQGHQLPSLNDAVHVGVMKKPLELNELH